MLHKRYVFLFFSLFLTGAAGRAQSQVPPFDIWNSQVLSQIRDGATLELTINPQQGFRDVFFTSNHAAKWFDYQPPYAEHRDGKIRIHGFLAGPSSGGPYPALVVGHGHGGSADRDMAQLIASFGYVVLAIDGPSAGQSTGGPVDQSQSWISVDLGPEYGYLYHYAYAGMRALTALEAMASQPGNPYHIDASKLGVLGASMGGIFTTHINAVDDRVKAAIIIASAGSWHHTLRNSNSWLYNAIYTETRDQPYNGADPLNSIENIDSDPTALQFMNYFDPIRYAPRQNAPVLTLIGTHDEYFPMPNANLMLQAITSAGTNPRFEKRHWLLSNAPHSLDNAADLLRLAFSLRQWLEYCFGNRDKPLASPQVTLVSDSSGLRFEVAMAEPAARLSGVRVAVYAGTRVDNASNPSPYIQDFQSYPAERSGDRFVARIPAGEVTASGDPLRADNVLYFATASDAAGLSISSLFYKAGQILDLSSNFVPAIRHTPNNNTSVPLPPAVRDAATTSTTTVTLGSSSSYQSMALSNPTSQPIAVRLEALSNAGRITAAEGLVNPVFVPLAPNSQQVFLAEAWFGSGARRLDGSFRMGWSDIRGAVLAFRGDVSPSELETIGPLSAAATRIWIPLAPEQDAAATRRLRIVSPPGASTAEIQAIFRSGQGTIIETRQLTLPPGGTVDCVPPSGSAQQRTASAEIRSSTPVSARLEVTGGRDTWSIEGRATPAAGTGAALQPHLEWNGMFTSRLLMLNTSASEATATLRLFAPAGSPMGTATQRTLPPSGVVSETVESIFGLSPSAARGAGWLAVENPGGGVLSAVLAVDPTGGAAAASALEPSASGPWSLPFFVDSIGYYTGLAMANGGEAPLTATLTAYSRDGAVLGRATVSLGSRQSRTLLISQWIPQLPGESTGHLVISATAPLSLVSYFGTDDLASLAAIPLRTIAP